MTQQIAVIGAGLAGCECAWQLARAGVAVTLFEMKPHRYSPAHVLSGLAELVCSNSFRSDEPCTAVGCLKREMRSLQSLILEVADATHVPAGKALAVDRELFSAQITRKVENHPCITLVRQEITSLDDPLFENFAACVLAAGPLMTDALTKSLLECMPGQNKTPETKQLFFYDAIAPVVHTDSVDMTTAFWGSRYRPEEQDYLNCPLTQEQYRIFYDALRTACKVPAHAFENKQHFEGCLPIETMAERGFQTLTFGPLKPVGLVNPHTRTLAYAVVQLRAENREKSRLNMVGFQTKLTYAEQERVFRLIPGLEAVRFERLGSMHRNTYVNAPEVLTPCLELRARKAVYLAGQLTGVEGYIESAACGLWLGLYLAKKIKGKDLALPPVQTATGALLNHLQTPAANFQPSNIQFGLMPGPAVKANKKKRKELYSTRAATAWQDYCAGL